MRLRFKNYFIGKFSVCGQDIMCLSSVDLKQGQLAWNLKYNAHVLTIWQ